MGSMGNEPNEPYEPYGTYETKKHKIHKSSLLQAEKKSALDHSMREPVRIALETVGGWLDPWDLWGL